jgi:hypothetical protein
MPLAGAENIRSCLTHRGAVGTLGLPHPSDGAAQPGTLYFQEAELLSITRQRLLSFALVLVFTAAAVPAWAEQTIVFFRHGEKPASGLGQLTCQGLNRALALPAVLLAKYGKPDYLYAPNPAVKMTDPGGSFFYIRPLATIEPTAVRTATSVNTGYGYSDIGSVQRLLIKSSKADSTIFVAWEHQYLVKLVQNIMNSYGGGQTVPAWVSGDYDSLYVVRVRYTANGITAQFDRDSEGLNGQPTACPAQ